MSSTKKKKTVQISLIFRGTQPDSSDFLASDRGGGIQALYFIPRQQNTHRRVPTVQKLNQPTLCSLEASYLECDVHTSPSAEPILSPSSPLFSSPPPPPLSSVVQPPSSTTPSPSSIEVSRASTSAAAGPGVSLAILLSNSNWVLIPAISVSDRASCWVVLTTASASLTISLHWARAASTSSPACASAIAAPLFLPSPALQHRPTPAPPPPPAQSGKYGVEVNAGHSFFVERRQNLVARENKS